MKFLLDEHYPPSLARSVTAKGFDTVALVADRPLLVGASDVEVLRTATIEGRVVVTEDVTTFSLAIAAVPQHVGVVYCRSSVFHRTPAGLVVIERSLAQLAATPPEGLGVAPIVWWLEPVRAPS